MQLSARLRIRLGGNETAAPTREVDTRAEVGKAELQSRGSVTLRAHKGKLTFRNVALATLFVLLVESTMSP
jgi:hypothetical protein